MSTSLPQKFYVYTLSYPNGTIFYVGKGIGARMYYHEEEARKGKTGTRYDVIRSIWANGGKIVYTKVEEFEDEKEAFKFESKMIKELGSILTNQPVGGNNGIFQKNNLNPFGKVLEIICALCGISWQTAAALAEIDPSTLSKRSHIGSDNPRRETVLAICNGLRQCDGWEEAYSEKLLNAARHATAEQERIATDTTELQKLFWERPYRSRIRSTPKTPTKTDIPLQQSDLFSA